MKSVTSPPSQGLVGLIVEEPHAPRPAHADGQPEDKEIAAALKAFENNQPKNRGAREIRPKPDDMKRRHLLAKTQGYYFIR